MARLNRQFRNIIAAIVLLGMLGLSSCFDVPLGDPSQSKVDERLLGYWHIADMGESPQVVKIARWDDHTYGVVFQSYLQISAQVVPGKTDAYKGWLTNVGGRMFITLQPLTALPMGGAEQKPVYIVARLEVEADQISAYGLKPDAQVFDEVTDSASLARVLEAHGGDQAIYLDEKHIFRRMDPAGEREKRILQAID